MKLTKIIAVAASCFLLSQTTNAQSNLGRFYIGGETNLNFSSKTNGIADDENSEDQLSITQFEITPKLGIFTTENLLIGVSIPLSYTKQKYEDFGYGSQDNEVSQFYFILAPFVNLYLTNGNLRPFLTLSAGAGTVNLTGSNSSSYGLGQFRGGGGLAILLNDFISLDLNLQYEYLAQYSDGDNPNNFHSFSKGIDFKFGLSAYL